MFGWLRALNIQLFLGHSSHQGHAKFQCRGNSNRNTNDIREVIRGYEEERFRGTCLLRYCRLLLRPSRTGRIIAYLLERSIIRATRDYLWELMDLQYFAMKIYKIFYRIRSIITVICHLSVLIFKTICVISFVSIQ